MGRYPWNRATPDSLLQGVLFPSFLLLGLLTLGNCARAPKPVSDVPPKPVSATATTSDDAPDAQGEPAQDRQALSKSSADIRILQSVLDSHPDTVVSLETQIALARTYERSGDRKAALQIYREVVKHTPSPSSKNFRQQALERIAVLEAPTKQVHTPVRQSVAVMVPASRMPPRKQWEQWLRALQKAEVTHLILEVGTKPVRDTGSSPSQSATPQSSGRSHGVFFHTKWAPVKKPVLNQIIPLAHKKGIAVFGAVTLRRMPWLEPTVGWADWVYRLDTNRLERSKALDIFHPAVQDYHVGFLADLVKSGIDGVLFRADAPMGPFEGLTRFGLAEFRRQYGIELNARILFPPPARVARHKGSSPSSSTADANKRTVTSRFSPAYWKWEGWKVREQLQVMGRYVTTIRKQAPALQIAVEVHRDAISKPIEAMLRYSEDAVETKQLGIHYLVTPMGTSGSRPIRLSDATDQNAEREAPAPVSFMTQALEAVEGPEEIWVMRHLPHDQVATIGEVIPVRRDQLSLPKGVGLLYTLGRPALP